jgi:hypothetical protein
MASLFVHVKTIMVQDWSCKFISSAQQNRGLSNFMVRIMLGNGNWKITSMLAPLPKVTTVSGVEIGYGSCDVPCFIYFLDTFFGSSI